MKCCILLAIVAINLVGLSNGQFFDKFVTSVNDGAKKGFEKTKEAFHDTREFVHGIIFPSHKNKDHVAATTASVNPEVKDEENQKEDVSEPAKADDNTAVNKVEKDKTIVKSDDGDKKAEEVKPEVKKDGSGDKKAEEVKPEVKKDGSGDKKAEEVKPEETKEVPGATTEGSPDGRENFSVACPAGKLRTTVGTCEAPY